MAERIKVADYQRQPLQEIEFPDGTVWKLRQPVEEDYYRRDAVVRQHQKRVQGMAKELADKAETAGDGEAVIEEEGDEARIPRDCTLRYLQASILAIFIEPQVTADEILDKLPLDLMHLLNASVEEVMVGEAAKKRLRNGSL